MIVSPAGSYFPAGEVIRIWLSEEYTRAAPGGTGAAKCGGNYAASLVAQAEAAENGCEQVAFLDAVERKWVEELGGMNLYFVLDDGSVVARADRLDPRGCHPGLDPQAGDRPRLPRHRAEGL